MEVMSLKVDADTLHGVHHAGVEMIVRCCRSGDTDSHSEDLREAAWYQPGLPRSHTHIHTRKFLLHCEEVENRTSQPC